jgi:hypothetical protein
MHRKGMRIVLAIALLLGSARAVHADPAAATPHHVGLTLGISTATKPPRAGGQHRPFALIGSTARTPASVAFAPRVVLQAAEGGSGLGAHWSAHITTADDPETAMAGAADADLFVPTWGAVTYMPSCTWGVQAMAAYDVPPTDPSAHTIELGAGILWQPSAGCSAPHD